MIYKENLVKRHKYKNRAAFSKSLLDSLLLEDLWLLHYFQMLNNELLNDLAFWSGTSVQYLQELIKNHEQEVRARQTPKIIDVEIVNNEQPIQSAQARSEVPNI